MKSSCELTVDLPVIQDVGRALGHSSQAAFELEAAWSYCWMMFDDENENHAV